MKNVEYETVTRVMETWDAARRTSSDTELGHLILDRFLILEPKAKSMFGSVKKHGDTLVSLFDTVFQLLGPDVDVLEEVCFELGRRHAKMGVPKSYFPKMGLGLIHALQATLGEEAFSADDKDAWRDVYKKITDEILTAMDDNK